MTIEYQRSQAKAMQQYFRELNAQKAAEKAQCVAQALESCVLCPCLGLSLLAWVAALLARRMLRCCLWRIVGKYLAAATCPGRCFGTACASLFRVRAGCCV